jgi:hypothetical protein
MQVCNLHKIEWHLCHLFVDLSIYSLFNDAVNNLGCILLNDQMMAYNKFEIMWKEAVVTCTCISGICLEGAEENHEKCQNHWCLDQDSNQALLVYKPEALPCNPHVRHVIIV